MLTDWDFESFEGPASAPTRADLFRNTGVGHVFQANGREWRVVNTNPSEVAHRIIAGHPRGVVMVNGRLEEERALYAYLEGETLVARALSKRGPLAPVGRVLWREDMGGAAS